MYYSYENNYPIHKDQIPNRIRLENGLTRTDRETFTEEELISAGYVLIQNSSSFSPSTQTFISENNQWKIVEIEQQLKMSDTPVEPTIESQWQIIRKGRDNYLNELDWRFLRYHSQVRLGLTPTDNILNLDTYAQALRDITNQPDPFNIIWPSLTNS